MNKTELIALKRKVFYARLRWYDLLDKYFLGEKSYRGKSNRSTVKTIYFVSRGEWAYKLLRDIKSLQTKINSFGYDGSKKPRKLWLPTVIENADIITVVAYAAYSERNLSLEQAEKFIAKHGFDHDICNTAEYSALTHTGRNYKIRVEYQGEITYHSFTEWVVCLCTNKKLPQIKNFKDKGRLLETSYTHQLLYKDLEVHD